jgi:hypothetical protein
MTRSAARSSTLASAMLLAGAAALTALPTPAHAADAQAAAIQAPTLEVHGARSIERGAAAEVAVTYVCEAGTSQRISVELSGGANNGEGSKAVECTGGAVDDIVTVTPYLDFVGGKNVYVFASISGGNRIERLITLEE